MTLSWRNWAVRAAAIAVCGCFAVCHAGVAQQAGAKSGEAASQTPATTAKKASRIHVKTEKTQTGEDSNVKNKSMNSSKEEGMKLAPAKARHRGAGPGVCRLHVDNRTNAIVNIFIDGNYAGTVGPGGDLYASTGNGQSTFYGRIDIDSNTYIALGPSNFDCEDFYTWTITP